MGFSIEGRDIGSAIAEIRRKVDTEVVASFSGLFKHLNKNCLVRIKSEW